MQTSLYNLQFASSDCRIEIPEFFLESFSNEVPSGEVKAWIKSVAETVNAKGCIVFSIGKLRLTVEKSQRIAHRLADLLCSTLVELGAPFEMKVEIDKPQTTFIPEGFETRNLLPHHDGGHCTYLTPSRLDVPTWDTRLRVFSNSTFTTTHTHKIYQGIFMIDPGEALSVTSYYNWVQMVQLAYQKATGKKEQTVAEVANWLGENIRKALARQPEHKSKYLSLASALGSNRLVFQGIASHWAEGDFSDEEVDRFPELLQLTEDCMCGQCPSRVSRLFCRQLYETLGLSWTDVRKRFEVCLPSERYDFIIGHNITWLHGGIMGGRSRYFEPICFVMDVEPNSESYEKWLAAGWRQGGRFYERD